MTQKEAYDLGRRLGFEAAYWTTVEEAAADLYQDDTTRATLRDRMEEIAWERENNARDFSPWEHYAADINRSEPEWRVEGLWEKYEEGVGVGIRKAVGKTLAAVSDTDIRGM